MRDVVAVVLQVIVSVLLVGAIMPVILASFPATRSRGVGATMALGGIVALFLVLRFVWPRQGRS